MSKIKNIKRPPRYNQIELRALSVPMNIGCTAGEQSQLQEVRIHLCMRLAKLPKGAISDDLNDTICYGDLADEIRSHCSSQPYRLLEKLGFDIYQICKRKVGRQATIAVAVSKVQPPVVGLLGGSHFSCGDFQI